MCCWTGCPRTRSQTFSRYEVLGAIRMPQEKPPLMIIPIELGLKLSRPLRPLCYKLRKSFPGMKGELNSAEIEIEDYEYLGLAIINVLFYFLLFFGLLFTLVYRVQGKPLLEALGMGLMYSFGINALIGYALFTYPKIIGGKKAEEVNKNLVFALRDLLMQVTSGVPLYRGLVNVASAGYGQVSLEFERTAKAINANTPVEVAFKNMALHTKSDYLKRVTWQLVNTIKAGSSLKSALRIIVNDLTLDQRSKIRDYAHELNLWSLVYMIFAVAVPTIGTVMMVLLSSFMGMGIGKPTFIMFMVICLGIQYALISLIKSRRPMVDF
jgi:pilus assembly protein TadC